MIISQGGMMRSGTIITTITIRVTQITIRIAQIKIVLIIIILYQTVLNHQIITLAIITIITIIAIITVIRNTYKQTT